MANIKSAKKKAKQAEKHRAANSQKKTKLRTYIKKVRNLKEQGKSDEAAKAFKDAASIIDKSANKKLIHKNKANRLKSRLAKNTPAKSEKK